MQYDEDALREINANADLLAYAQQTFELVQRGDDFYCHCPLHVDKTPSLSFNPQNNFYYCFSCGKSGGMIGFLMDFEGLSFDDAVKKAAKIAKVDISKMCHSQTIAFLKKWRNLLLSQKHKRVEKHEILPPATMDRFSKEAVPEWLEEGIPQSEMDAFGVRIDNIGNRIVYPVYDVDGNLINVKGRTRYPNYKTLRLPKYINYYKVGTMDYFQGLNITLPDVKAKNEIIIFESIKSVMKARGWGYLNCVSAEKHTLTPEQIELLVKLRVDVVLAYDSDVEYRSGNSKISVPGATYDHEQLKRFTNVYIIEDRNGLLGGKEAKNAPVDCGLETWETLYDAKRKVV